MNSSIPATKPQTGPPPRVLIVDDEPTLREMIEDVVRDGIRCRVVCASNLLEARNILITQSIDILIADVNLPDGDGTSLLALLHRHQPTASAIVITGDPTLASAITAIRAGALDFVPKPFTNEQLMDRLRSALDRQARANKADQRFTRLKVAVKRLNESRRLISRKVDLLCNDLVSAYGDLSRQLDDVRTQEGFRKAIAGAKDLEQLLCHAMDWLLREVGYSNVAVYLAGDDGDFQLGAYMKYTLAGDARLTDAVKRVLLPPTAREAVLHTNINTFEKRFTAPEFQLLKNQDLLAVNCTYLGESLASVLFFRDMRSPFTADDEAVVRSISAIFAISLATVVRDPQADDGGASAQESEPDQPPRPRHDPADWWKQGDDSPY
ncbi:MAG TPA: response regulator [Tepidisphaeraceae bacterium]|jgi:FixJ family two-component response regulator|nr:response regulator [Tepidisphaeraceae bacterium]